jgi:hypothetical protein
VESPLYTLIPFLSSVSFKDDEENPNFGVEEFINGHKKLT